MEVSGHLHTLGALPMQKALLEPNESGAQPEILIREADHGAIGNLCFILKPVLQKSCHNYNCNMTLFSTAFIYIELHVP